MTSLLFSLLAATSLAAAGMSAPGETRSAQSLPADHLLVAPANPASTGKLHTVNRLADATTDNVGTDQSDQAKCAHQGGHWDESKQRCRKGLAWEVPVIGAATTAGLIYALSSGDGGPGTGSISH